MKTVFFLWLTLMFGAPTKPPVEEYTIEGKITVSSSYCGGAAPDPDMLRELQTPKGFSGKRLYIRKGASNDLSLPIVDTIVADNEGHFRVQLPKGTYTIVGEHHLDKSILNKDFGRNVFVDAECLDKWWNRGLSTIQLDTDTSGLNFHFSKRCFIPVDIPCLNYMGPYPP